MTRDVCTVVRATMILLLALVFLNFVSAASLPFVTEQSTPSRNTKTVIRFGKMCSTRLSNILSVVCEQHGYNGPDTGDGQMRFNSGPGLVEECCHNSCTLDQLLLYCKASPSSDENDILNKDTTTSDTTRSDTTRSDTTRNNIIFLTNDSHRLADQSHSYSTSMTVRSSELNSHEEANSDDSAAKRKNMKKERHRGTRGRNSACKEKSDGKKRHHRGRHCRCRRRRLECRRAGKIVEP